MRKFLLQDWKDIAEVISYILIGLSFIGKNKFGSFYTAIIATTLIIVTFFFGKNDYM
jgi:hypothetical protein